MIPAAASIRVTAGPMFGLSAPPPRVTLDAAMVDTLHRAVALVKKIHTKHGSLEAARARLAEQQQQRAAASAPAKRPTAPAVQAPPRAQPRQRSRRSTAAKRPAAKAGSDDGPGGQRAIVVSLGPVDPIAVQRLARLLVERATAEVLNRALGAQHSDAVSALTPTAPRGEGE